MGRLDGADFGRNARHVNKVLRVFLECDRFSVDAPIEPLTGYNLLLVRARGQAPRGRRQMRPAASTTAALSRAANKTSPRATRVQTHGS